MTPELNSEFNAETLHRQGTAPHGTLGQYRLLRELGRGAMGVVYEAEHPTRGTRVALKTLMSPMSGSLLSFKSEFRSLAELTHRNLVGLIELVTDCEPPFFTMQLLRGVNFLEYVRGGFDSASPRSTSLCDPVRLRDALLQAAEGLEALHQAGKLHRDIKPNNVLVQTDGTVVLVDFGLAVDVDEDVYRNSIREQAGTPYYMSPEQITGQPLSYTSDWYNLGVMLFEALTGELPFQASSFDELQRLKLEPHPPAPCDRKAEVPTELNDLCVGLLQPDPDKRLSGAEVLSRLRGSHVPHPQRAAWVGREKPLRRLEAALAEVENGEPLTVLVHGRSGMGKTALINRFLDGIHQRGRVVVLRGRCYENESVPYKGFDAVVDALCRFLRREPPGKVERLLPLEIASLCRIFPVLREVPAVQYAESYHDAPESRRRGLSALREMLKRLAFFEQLVIFIDDLQWGDLDTAALFQEIVRQPGAPRCLIIGSFRSEQPSVCVEAIREKEQPEAHQQEFVRQLEISVDALDPPEATELALDLIGERSERAVTQARTIARESGGNPLFVKVLSQHLSEAQREGDGFRLSLEDVLWKQISALPREQREAVELVAVAGRPISHLVIQKAADFDEDPLLLMRELSVRRLVRNVGSADPDAVEAYHDRIRETVLQKLDQSKMARCAGRLVGAVQDTGTAVDPEFMASLLVRAGRQAEAGGYFAEAADRSMETLAFSRAVHLYRQALAALRPQGDEELRLRVGLADALAHAGRGAEAAKEYLRAAEAADPDRNLDLSCQAARRYLTSGHVDEGLATLSGVLSSVGMPLRRTPLRALLSLAGRRLILRLRGLRFHPSPPESLKTRQRQLLDVSWSAAAGLSVVDPIRASYFVTRNLLLALRAGEPRYLARAIPAQVGHIAVRGRRSRRAVARFLRASRRVARLEGGPYSRATRELARGIAAHLHGRWNAAQKSCDRAVAYLMDRRCKDVTWEVDTARTFAMWALTYKGEVGELMHRQPELLRTARETHDLFALLNFGTSVMTYTRLGADQPDQVRRRLQEEQQLLSERGFFVQHHNWLLASTFVELYTGDPAAAWETVRDGWCNYSKSYLGWVEQVRIDFLQVHGRAAVAFYATEPEKPNWKAARKTIRRLRRERAAWGGAMAELLEAGVATVHGQREVARQRYERAASLLDAVDMHLFAAAARYRQEQLLAEKESPPSESLARRQMRELGVRNPPRMVAALAPGVFPSEG